jgi:hypothetical protein
MLSLSLRRHPFPVGEATRSPLECGPCAAAANQDAARVIIEASKIRDSAWQGWEKLQWVHQLPTGGNIAVHFMRNVLTGETADFKIVESALRMRSG